MVGFQIPTLQLQPEDDISCEQQKLQGGSKTGGVWYLDGLVFRCYIIIQIYPDHSKHNFLVSSDHFVLNICGSPVLHFSCLGLS